VIDRGDSYPQEVGAGVQRVVERLGAPNPYLLAYQSEVGPVRWLGPSTEQVIRRLGARGEKRVLVVPIAFTSDHIETLSELDREYGEVAHQAGIAEYHRSPALNERPRFLDALAELVHQHLRSGAVSSSQYSLRCAGCTNPQCRNILSPISGSPPRERPQVSAAAG
jgi:ferrochelatase